MNRRMRTIRSLLWVYPKTWRSEYGCELAATLHRRSLTTAVICDILRNGIRQRLRYAAPWQLGGYVSLLWMTFGTALNSIAPLSQSAYNQFFQICLLIQFAVGYKTATLPEKTLSAASLASCKAALLGIAPEILLDLLWATNLIHPTILDMNSSPSTVGYGITELCMRLAQGVPANPHRPLIFVPVLAILQAMFLGYIGAVASKTITAFKTGLHRA